MASSEDDTPHKDTSESDSETSETFLSTKQNSESLKNILSTMSKEKLERYESFRRVGFKRNMIKRLCLEIIGQSCNPKFIIAVCGFAKVFVGELIEEAKSVQEEWGESGPLMATHIHEAYRRLYNTHPNLVVNPQSPW